MSHLSHFVPPLKKRSSRGYFFIFGASNVRRTLGAQDTSFSFLIHALDKKPIGNWNPLWMSHLSHLVTPSTKRSSRGYFPIFGASKVRRTLGAQDTSFQFCHTRPRLKPLGNWNPETKNSDTLFPPCHTLHKTVFPGVLPHFWRVKGWALVRRTTHQYHFLDTWVTSRADCKLEPPKNKKQHDLPSLSHPP
jgi:hypothetical protein